MGDVSFCNGLSVHDTKGNPAGNPARSHEPEPVSPLPGGGGDVELSHNPVYGERFCLLVGGALFYRIKFFCFLDRLNAAGQAASFEPHGVGSRY